MNHQAIGERSSEASSTTNNANRAVLLPQPFPIQLPYPENDFLQDEPEYHESFEKAIETAYEGFVVDRTVESLDERVVQESLERLREEEYFRHDITQPFGLGTRCAKTYVSRCLVGEPGTTYKYLGLRMFSHPWHSKSSSKGIATHTALEEVGHIGASLSSRTSGHLEELAKIRRLRGASMATLGRSTFDICLINRMEATQDRKSEQSVNRKGTKTSVSWHADSSLEHYSTIAVYQTLLPKSRNSTDAKLTKESDATGSQGPSREVEKHANNWYVALRVAHHAEGPQASHRGSNIDSALVKETPPIAVSLPSGSAYYLLDDFNHHHQHTVLTMPSSRPDSSEGSDFIRYSCTYRLLRDSHNVEHILRRCQSAISDFHKKGPKLWRSEQLLLNEVESEWIRQFYIQGTQHFELLAGDSKYWHEPLQKLLSYWSRLERRTKQVVDLLQYAAIARCQNSDKRPDVLMSKAAKKHRERQRKGLASIEDLLRRNSQGGSGQLSALDLLYRPFAELLDSRAKLRELWTKREGDSLFHTLSHQNRPKPLPFVFGYKDAENSISDQNAAYSPLPGSPEALYVMADSIRRSGKGYDSLNPKDLPSDGLEVVSQNDASKSSNHVKHLSWEGWGEVKRGAIPSSNTFALELQEPWAGAVVDGTKTIETRAYELPPPLLGKKIWILQSPSGQAGVSAMENVIDLTKDAAQIIGWCRFSKVIKYASRDQFEIDRERHLVAPTSGYGWIKGKTKVVYGWIVAESRRTTCDDFATAVRRMRSLFQLKEPNQVSKKRRKTDKPSDGKRKRKKRF